MPSTEAMLENPAARVDSAHDFYSPRALMDYKYSELNL